MTELWALSAAEQARAIRTRAASAREVVSAVLARHEATHPAINALVEMRADEALQAADAADRAVARGEALGPLHGVPVTLKVNIDQQGYATTNGVVAFKDQVAAVDSPVVANLRRAGAIPMGRTNTPAFSYRFFTDNALHGRTLNPRNPRLTPGGSSGGASASVAVGVASIAHGNDLGGSIRYPAYAVGVAGIRPSFGRVPAFNGTAPDERPITLQMMSVQGPLARTVGDLRLGLAAMAQPDPRDPWYAPAPLELPLPPRPWRIAFSTLGADEPVAAALRQAAGWLAEAGCAVEEVGMPRFEEAAELWRGLLMTEGERVMSPVIEKYGDAQIKAAYAGWAANVPTLEPAAFAAGLARRTAIWRDWSVFLSAYAAALLPVSLEPPFPQDLDQKGAEAGARILRAQAPLYVFNLLGLPGLSVPTATMADGIPLGVQIVAARFREDICLALGEIIEARAGVTGAIDPVS
ncbi:amidase family protein [Elioraea rosea]|uniref:amidase family protein n=1 Tax=Elioraea rosea TaxID=2492390 RepID=UPI00118373C9|nr:amidase family protein [Elioraea rosea]